jgi:hypothetical protein
MGGHNPVINYREMEESKLTEVGELGIKFAKRIGWNKVDSFTYQDALAVFPEMNGLPFGYQHEPWMDVLWAAGREAWKESVPESDCRDPPPWKDFQKVMDIITKPHLHRLHKERERKLDAIAKKIATEVGFFDKPSDDGAGSAKRAKRARSED